MIRMKFINEMVDASFGSIDEYLSGQEEFKMDRRGYKSDRSISGKVYVTIEGEQYGVMIYRSMERRYVAWIFIDDDKYNGNGASPKQAFFDLLHRLRKEGM